MQMSDKHENSLNIVNLSWNASQNHSEDYAQDDDYKERK